MNLTFERETHTYHLDGAVVPSVTQVLAPLYDFERIPRDVLERKRQIGDSLDIAIQLELAADLVEESIDPSILGYLEAFRRFRVEQQFIAVEIQKPVYSKMFRFAGTPDAWGSIKGHDAVPDWKATYAMHPAVALQTAGYLGAGHEQGLLKATTARYGVQFCEDGRYNIVPYKDKSDWGIFLSFLSTHNWRVKNGLLKEKS